MIDAEEMEKESSSLQAYTWSYNLQKESNASSKGDFLKEKVHQYTACIENQHNRQYNF